MTKMKLHHGKINWFDALEQSHGEIEALKDELSDWYDSLAERGHDSTDKACQLEEAIDYLSTAEEELWSYKEDIDRNRDACKYVLEDITYGYCKRKHQTRSFRLQNVMLMLQAMRDACDDVKADAIKRYGDEDVGEDRADFMDELSDMIERAELELENVEFPRMFG